MNNTLTDGMKLLKALAESEGPRTVKELAGCFSWPPSHACRLLKTLVDSGYVEQDAKRRYTVSLKILTLSNAALQRMESRRRLRPFIERLARESGCPVHLSAPDDYIPIVVDVAYPEGCTYDAGISIGAVNPVHVSAGGKVCAAFHPLETLDAFLDGVDFVKYTERTITSKKAFKRELEIIRKEKVAIALEERGRGTSAMGAPVFSPEGALCAVIGMILKCGQPSKQETARLKALLSEIADAASFAMGYPHWKSYSHKQD